MGQPANAFKLEVAETIVEVIGDVVREEFDSLAQNLDQEILREYQFALVRERLDEILATRREGLIKSAHIDSVRKKIDTFLKGRGSKLREYQNVNLFYHNDKKEELSCFVSLSGPRSAGNTQRFSVGVGEHLFVVEDYVYKYVDYKLIYEKEMGNVISVDHDYEMIEDMGIELGEGVDVYTTVRFTNQYKIWKSCSDLKVQNYAWINQEALNGKSVG